MNSSILKIIIGLVISIITYVFYSNIVKSRETEFFGDKFLLRSILYLILSIIFGLLVIALSG